MTERSNDATDDDLDPMREPPPPTEGGDESAAERAETASDLSDAQLRAAAADAASDVDEGVDADVETESEVAEADAEELDDEEEEAADDEGAVAPPRPVGARARYEERRARGTSRETGGRGPREPRATRTSLPIDPALRIKDPSSTIFVAGTIVVFLLVFLNAMAFGKNGAFTAGPTPPPTAVPSASPSTSGSPAPSSSSSPSASPAITPAPTPSASPAAS